jgi:hypothetical protein
MSLSVRTMMAAALAFGGAMVLQPQLASAQGGYDLYRNGVRVTGPAYAPYRQGFRAGYGGPRYGFHGGYRPAYYGQGYRYRSGFYGPRYGYGYRPVYYGSRYYGGYYPYGSYRRGYNGGAVAAGLIGGLALGTIASAIANPYPYGSYYSPAYYSPARTCYVERRRVVNRYGRVGIRRVQTCY